MPSIIYVKRCIVQIKWYDHISNQKVTSWTGLSSIGHIISCRCLGLFGYVAQLDTSVPIRDVSGGLEKANWTSKADLAATDGSIR